MVPKWPIFKALSALRWAKIAQHALKMDSFHLFVHPKWSKGIFGKPHFDPFLTDFSSQNSPFSRHFVTLAWPKWLAMGSKRALFTCLGTPNGVVLKIHWNFEKAKQLQIRSGRASTEAIDYEDVVSDEE